MNIDLKLVLEAREGGYIYLPSADEILKGSIEILDNKINKTDNSAIGTEHLMTNTVELLILNPRFLKAYSDK